MCLAGHLQYTVATDMLIQQNAVLFLAVSLPALVMCGVPHSHGVKKGHAEREDDGAYRFQASFSFRN